MQSENSTSRHAQDIRVVTTLLELNEVRKLRAASYATMYPSIDVFSDKYDSHALVYFTRAVDGQVNSTARLAIDGDQGLPEDRYFPAQVAEYRNHGLGLMELGRFIIRDSHPTLLKQYYRTFYDAAVEHGVDIILMAMKPKDVSLHRRIMGATLLEQNMGVSYGGAYSLACVAWNIQNTKPRFFDWIEAAR